MTSTPVGFYVTAREGRRVGWLLGPYRSRDAAAGNVERARLAAVEIDPWTHFAGFGATRLVGRPGRTLPAGILNSRIGLFEGGAGEHVGPDSGDA